jgi:hypothetical protein
LVWFGGIYPVKEGQGTLKIDIRAHGFNTEPGWVVQVVIEASLEELLSKGIKVEVKIIPECQENTLAMSWSSRGIEV